MRKFWVIYLAVLLGATACEKEDYKAFNPDDPDSYFVQFVHNKLPKELPDGWSRESNGDVGFRGSPFNLYFLDEQGNDLLDIEDESTWPMPYFAEGNLTDPAKWEYCSGIKAYETNVAHIIYADLIGINQLHIVAPIDGSHVVTFPFVYKDKRFEVKITYLYESKYNDAYYYTHIFKWEIDGEVFYSDFYPYRLNPAYSAVFVVKSNGDVEIRNSHYRLYGK